MRKIGNLKFNNIDLFLALGGILTCIFFGYIFYQTYQSERSLISLMIIPLIAGIIIENLRLSSGWASLLLRIFGALLFSVLAFLPGKSEGNYILENHIEMWPYWFVIFFVVFSAISHEKKIIPKLTEGITLLQSIAIIYWIIDIGFFNFHEALDYILIGIGLFFILFSFLHAFTYLKLARNTRLYLSIWSSIIMVIFGVDFIYRVFNFDYFADNIIINDQLNILQYFLLGVSLIYIFQNAFMLLVYIPSKRRFYGKEHMKEIRTMNKTHIKRYSQKQIKISDSLLALIITSIIYYINYIYHIIPRHTLIWLIFWVFPLILWMIGRLKKLHNEKI